MLEDDLQSPTIAADQPIVSALRLLPPLSLLERGHPARILLLKGALPDRPTPAGLPGWGPRGWATAPIIVWIISSVSDRFQETAAKHWGQTQRNETRNQNRDTDGDRKLAKQSSENAAQKEHRNKDRHQ